MTPNPSKKENKNALKEWVYIQSSLKNDTVLLGMILGVELSPYLDRRDDDGALVPCLKMKIVAKSTPEQIESQKKVFLDRKMELLKELGDTNPEVKMVDSMIHEFAVPEGKTQDEATKEYFWEIYTALEKQYEAGFVPTVVGDQGGIYPSYTIQPKPNVSDTINKPVDNAVVAESEKVV